MSILIVDDTKSIRSLIEFYLKEQGYGSILHAESGEQALQLLTENAPKTRQEKPELILLDVIMPGMDGSETCRQIRQDSRFADVSIIMITSDMTPQTIEAIFEAGANEVIPKPLDKTTLLAKVSAAFSNKRL